MKEMMKNPPQDMGLAPGIDTSGYLSARGS